jgi:hypothetical protein
MGISKLIDFFFKVGINIQQKLQQLMHKIPRHYTDSRREVRLKF